MVVSAALGSVAEQAEELLTASDELAAILAGMGEGGIVELFFAFFMGILAVTAAGFTSSPCCVPATKKRRGAPTPSCPPP